MSLIFSLQKRLRVVKEYTFYPWRFRRERSNNYKFPQIYSVFVLYGMQYLCCKYFLNIFLGIYYICVFENKTKKLSWMCRNLKDIYYSPHNLPEVHDPILFLDKTLFYEKIHFKALFNWTNENHTHDHIFLLERKPVKSLLTYLVVIWPEQLNILFKDHLCFDIWFKICF